LGGGDQCDVYQVLDPTAAGNPVAEDVGADDGAELIGYVVGQWEGAVGRPDEPVDVQRSLGGDFIGLSAHRGPDHDVDVKRRPACGAEHGPHLDSGSLGHFLKRHDPGDLEPEEVTEMTVEGPPQRRRCLRGWRGVLGVVDVDVLAVPGLLEPGQQGTRSTSTQRSASGPVNSLARTRS
jgi:hypothetical protein